MTDADNRSETTYWGYIKLEELLQLQAGLGQDSSALADDEHLFIVVHQVFELWFNLALRSLTSMRDALKSNPVPEDRIASAVENLERVSEIFRIGVEHFGLIETMSTRSYLEFRDKLFPASGFQSAQLRELEIVLGLPDEERIPFGGHNSWREALRLRRGGDSPALARIERRLADRPNLKEVVEEWLYRTPIQGSSPEDAGDAELVREFLEAILKGHEAVCQRQLAAARARGDTEKELADLQEQYRHQIAQARDFLMPEGDERATRLRAAVIFINGYPELPLLAWPRRLLDSLIVLEQRFVMFRQRHARMVERVIGRRVGTGGSAGVAYLDETARKYRIFKDLWAARTLMLAPAELPKLRNREFYLFRQGS
jgi:tryptophan 2,3-dioxygenase